MANKSVPKVLVDSVGASRSMRDFALKIGLSSGMELIETKACRLLYLAEVQAEMRAISARNLT